MVKLLNFLFVVIISLSLFNQLIAQSKSDSTLVEEISTLIIENIDTIKTEYHKVAGLKDYPFQTASLFILSDVILLNWQLDNINRSLFGNTIAVRYASSDSNTLFEHRTQKIGKYEFGLYGNQLSNKNFVTVNKEAIESIFGIKSESNLLDTKEELLNMLIKYNSKADYNLPKNLINGFNELGLMQREIMSIPVLTNAEYDELFNIAKIITNELNSLISFKKIEVEETFRKSKLGKNITIQEYFNNWYKNLTTKATNNLIELGYIKMPAPRNFNFIIIDKQ